MPVLIVNADDWGYSERVTQAIVHGFDEGTVSSTTAMVWQRDSERAAEIARERRLPVGLHLNLTAPYRADEVPARPRERQLRLTEQFGKQGWRVPDVFTGDRTLLRDTIRDQLDRFREDIGEPTHLDGHHHVHVHNEVLELLPEILPADLPVRAVPRTPPRSDDERDAREAGLYARWPAPDLVWEFHHLHPELGGAGLEWLDRAQTMTVEIVTHPAEDNERLDGAAWRAATGGLELGSYRDLAELPRPALSLAPGERRGWRRLLRRSAAL